MLLSRNKRDRDSSSPLWIDSKTAAKEFSRRYKCAFCGDTFEYRHNLTHHMTETCLKNANSNTNKTAGKFKCYECGRQYGQAKSLRYHERHECRQTVTCQKCFKVFRGAHVPERHKQFHCVDKLQNKKVKKEVMEELWADCSGTELEELTD